jgi:hypothetical protein
MKNIHVLPTDKPSRLHITSKLMLYPNGLMPKSQGLCTNQHIYITSDEEIKVGDWIFDIVTKRIEIAKFNHDILKRDWKKIILTTDQDLIKNGVQSIDDEFLEWFVKNPSCEFVETERLEDGQYFDYLEDNSVIEGIYENYKIIIPKEEPKQEWDINTCRYWDMEIGCEREKCICENQEPKPITDWLEANGNPEIDKQVEREAEALMKQHNLEEIAKKRHRELSTAPIGIVPNFTDGFIEGYKLSEQRIETLRNELYDQLPTGDVNAFDLIKIINNHIKKLDELIQIKP